MEEIIAEKMLSLEPQKLECNLRLWLSFVLNPNFQHQDWNEEDK